MKTKDNTITIGKDNTIKTEGYGCLKCGSENSTVVQSPEFSKNLYEMDMTIKCAQCGEESTIKYEVIM